MIRSCHSMGPKGNGKKNDTHYASMDRSDVPQGRRGKHRKAVADILADLSKLNSEQAIKIPLSSLNGEKMQNLRSALNRVTRGRNIRVVTSSDEKYLYVWHADAPGNEREKTSSRPVPQERQASASRAEPR